VKSPASRPASAGNVSLADDLSRCQCSAKTSDESQLNNKRLDDIAFYDHLIQNVYRKDSINDV